MPVCQPGPMIAARRSPVLSWTAVVPLLAAVHHAEVVAHRVGEPFGSLVLAVAVTVIEVGLIVTLMVAGEAETASLARDTVFAAVMITTNGIVGLSLLLGALRYGVTLFNAEGTAAPRWRRRHHWRHCAWCCRRSPRASPARSSPGPARLRCVGRAGVVRDVRAHPDRAPPGLLPADRPRGRTCGEPRRRTGRPPRANPDQSQPRLRIGHCQHRLTIPAIAVASIWLDGPLLLGLGSTQMVLLALTVVVSVLTVVPGRATRLQSGIHLVLLAAFLFLSINP